MLAKNILISFNEVDYLLLNVFQLMKDGWYYIRSPRDYKAYFSLENANNTFFNPVIKSSF